MAVLLPGKFLYLATPHTGSIALTAALGALSGALPSPIHEAGFKGREDALPKGTHHASRSHLMTMCPDLFVGGEVAFAVRRNPYDLIVTWWLRQRHHMAKKSGGPEMSLFEFVEAYSEKSPGPYLREGRIFWMDADRWLRYENLDEEVNQLLVGLGVAPVEVPRKNITSQKEPWRIYYDAKTLNTVNRRWGSQIEEAGYEKISG